MLTMGSYLWYARKPGIGRYLTVCSLFLLGMASKAMIVTLPFLLVLLDFYPLHRVIGKGSPPVESSPWKRAALPVLVLEKMPLILLAAAASAAAVYSRERPAPWFLSIRTDSMPGWPMQSSRTAATLSKLSGQRTSLSFIRFRLPGPCSKSCPMVFSLSPSVLAS